jgi:hypothetical protein
MWEEFPVAAVLLILASAAASRLERVPGGERLWPFLFSFHVLVLLILLAYGGWPTGIIDTWLVSISLCSCCSCLLRNLANAPM